MSTKELIQAIKKLPIKERQLIIEMVMKTLNESSDFQLEKAAKALLSDYKTDKRLTSFTAIDFEEFYEAR